MRKRRPDSASNKKRTSVAPVPRHRSTRNFLIPRQPRGVFVFLPISDRAPRVDLCASGGPIPRHQKNTRGPGAAAPQHAKFFDSQPRGVFVFFPISDIRYRTRMHRAGRRPDLGTKFIVTSSIFTFRA
jgi:hypothetical protein